MHLSGYCHTNDYIHPFIVCQKEPSFLMLFHLVMISKSQSKLLV